MVEQEVVDLDQMTNEDLAEYLYKQKDTYNKMRMYLKQLEQKS